MTDNAKTPFALVILDGWGCAQMTERNAIALAHTPNYDRICSQYPMTTLLAAGPALGQSPDASGTAEIGHLSIGTGRLAHAEAYRIESAIGSGDFVTNAVLIDAIKQAAQQPSTLHLVGLISDAAVHSSNNTLFALLRMAKNAGVRDVAIHCFLDGLDVPPRTADVYVEALEIKLEDIGIGRIATLCGRFFAMDSRGNWERTARAFTMMVHAEGERSVDAVGSIRSSFLRGIADEFIAPIIIERSPGVPIATVKDGDVVIYFNHRPEGMRQLVRSLSVPDAMAGVKPMIHSVCLTEYDRTFGLPVAFPPETGHMALTDVLAAEGVRNTRITQSERFSHLTYFFSGGSDSQTTGEQTILVPSPRDRPIEIEPEGQSFVITDKALRAIESADGGVFIINLPAADLVAETGQIEKTIEAVQFVDTCLGGILDKVLGSNGIAIVTSTHGNCEDVGEAPDRLERRTASNRVPFHFVSNDADGLGLRSEGSLRDIAPTILNVLGLPVPSQMTGTDLRI